MDLSEEVLEKLKCVKCGNYLSYEPIYLKPDGGSVCGRCPAPVFHCTRNQPYEELAVFAFFPCRYQELGCKKKISFRYLKIHEDCCEFMPFFCPVGVSTCKWNGPRTQLLQHCEEMHPQQVLQHPCTQELDITKSSMNNYILTVFHVLFLLQTKVCLSTKKIFHCVRYIGDLESASLYKYKLKIQRSDVQVKKQGVVTSSQESVCLRESLSGTQKNYPRVSQMENCLVEDIDALLLILGGYEGTTFTITISMLLTQVRCVLCGENVTKPAYKDWKGWRCVDCAPKQIACQNKKKGCPYRDIQDKVQKHEYYYCKCSTWCWVCSKNTTIPLEEHYKKEHDCVIQGVGMIWRAKLDATKRLQIVASEVGVILCRYRYHCSAGIFSIHSPLHSEELSEYSCELRLTHPETGRCMNRTLEVKYDFVDWRTQIDPDIMSAIMNNEQECDVLIELIRKLQIDHNPRA